MAINKDRIVQIINGRADAANQPLPPAHAGLRQGLQGLRLRSGQGQGAAGRGRLSPTASTPSSTSTTPIPTRASPRRSSRISRRSASRPTSSRSTRPTSSPPAATRTSAPMIWSGGMAWIADFPDPSDFYGPILGCAGAVAGRLELVVVLQQGPRRARPPRPTRWSTRPRPTTAPTHVERDLRPRSWRTRPGRRCSTSSATPCTRRASAATDALFVDPVHIPVNYDDVYATDAQ